MRTGWRIFLGILVVLAIVFSLQALDFISLKFWAPKYENVKRDIFENTNSFTKGKRQEVAKYMLEYKRTTDPVEKNAIQFTLAQSLADFNEDDYVGSAEMLAFIKQMKYGSPLPIPIKVEPVPIE